MSNEEPKLYLAEVKKTHEENMKRLEELNQELKRLYRMKEEMILLQQQHEMWCQAEERRLAMMRLGAPPFPGYYIGPYYPYAPYPPNLW
jgi:hypothetical protein